MFDTRDSEATFAVLGFQGLERKLVPLAVIYDSK